MNNTTCIHNMFSLQFHVREQYQKHFRALQYHHHQGWRLQHHHLEWKGKTLRCLKVPHQYHRRLEFLSMKLPRSHQIPKKAQLKEIMR